MEKREILREIFQNEIQRKLDKYKILNKLAVKGQTLFTGSSLMEQFPVNELMMNEGMTQIIYNRGIGGYTTKDMLQHMDEQIFGTEPSRIFINIGTNDIGQGRSIPDIMADYETIITQTKAKLPDVEIYMMAYYPVNEVYAAKLNPDSAATAFKTRNNPTIQEANKAVEKLAEKLGCKYIDVNDGLADEDGRLKAEFTVEGIHMYANAYSVVLKNLKPYLS